MQCLVCGREDWRPCHAVLLRCGCCGFVTARLDAPIDPRRLYGGDYFTGGEYLDYPGDEAFLKRNFARRLAAVRRRCPTGRLIEVGAAYGFFLDLARAHFQVTGFEINPLAVGHARDRLKLDVRSGDFLAATPSDLGGPADVVVMWDVIEHLERPDLFVAHAAGLLRPGGWLFLTTGNIASLVARLRGRRWRMIHPPTHLHYFAPATITRLLGNHGFTVEEIRSVGVARSLRQVLYSIVALRLGRPRLYARLARRVPASWGLTLNTFDIMQVTARRTASPG